MSVTGGLSGVSGPVSTVEGSSPDPDRLFVRSCNLPAAQLTEQLQTNSRFGDDARSVRSARWNPDVSPPLSVPPVPVRLAQAASETPPVTSGAAQNGRVKSVPDARNCASTRRDDSKASQMRCAGREL